LVGVCWLGFVVGVVDDERRLVRPMASVEGPSKLGYPSGFAKIGRR